MKQISMGETEQPTQAYVVVTLVGENQHITQALHQMNKLIDVHEVKEMEQAPILDNLWLYEGEKTLDTKTLRA